MKQKPDFFVANNDPACLPRTWHKCKLAAEDLELHGLKERFLMGMDNCPRSKIQLDLPEVMFTKVYKPLDPVDLSKVEYEYIMPEIHAYEDRYGLVKEVLPVNKAILDDAQSQRSSLKSQTSLPSKKMKKLSNVRNTVKQ